jgi:hypothetical protein
MTPQELQEGQALLAAGAAVAANLTERAFQLGKENDSYAATIGKGASALGTGPTTVQIEQVVDLLSAAPDRQKRVVDVGNLLTDLSLQNDPTVLLDQVTNPRATSKDLGKRYIFENAFLVNAMHEIGVSEQGLMNVLVQKNMVGLTSPSAMGVAVDYNLDPYLQMFGKISDSGYVLSASDKNYSQNVDAYLANQSTTFGRLMNDSLLASLEYRKPISSSTDKPIVSDPDRILRSRFPQVLAAAFAGANINASTTRLTKDQMTALVSNVYKLGEAAIMDMTQLVSSEDYKSREELYNMKTKATSAFLCRINAAVSGYMVTFTSQETVEKGWFESKEFGVARQDVHLATNNLLAPFIDSEYAFSNLLYACEVNPDAMDPFESELYSEENRSAITFLHAAFGGRIDLSNMDALLTPRQREKVLILLSKTVNEIARYADPVMSRTIAAKIDIMSSTGLTPSNVGTDQGSMETKSAPVSNIDEDLQDGRRFALALEQYRQLFGMMAYVRLSEAILSPNAPPTEKGQEGLEALSYRAIATGLSTMPRFQMLQTAATEPTRSGMAGSSALGANTDINNTRSAAPNESIMDEKEDPLTKAIKHIPVDFRNASKFSWRTGEGITKYFGELQKEMENSYRLLNEQGKDIVGGVVNLGFGVAGARALGKFAAEGGLRDATTFGKLRAGRMAISNARQIYSGGGGIVGAIGGMITEGVDRDAERERESYVTQAVRATLYPRAGLGGELSPFGSLSDAYKTTKALFGFKALEVDNPVERETRLAEWVKQNPDNYVATATNLFGAKSMIAALEVVKTGIPGVIAGFAVGANVLSMAQATLAASWIALSLGKQAFATGKNLVEWFTADNVKKFMTDDELTVLKAQVMLLRGLPLTRAEDKFVSDTLELVPEAAFQELELNAQKVKHDILDTSTLVNQIMSEHILPEIEKFKKGQTDDELTYGARSIANKIVSNLNMVAGGEFGIAIESAVAIYLGVTQATESLLARRQAQGDLYQTIVSAYAGHRNMSFRQALEDKIRGRG